MPNLRQAARQFIELPVVRVLWRLTHATRLGDQLLVYATKDA